MTRHISLVFVLCLAVAITAPAQEFKNLANFNEKDGAYPGALVQGLDGTLYGTTATGEDRSYNGTSFKVTPDGRLTWLEDFLSVDAIAPTISLAQTTQGDFYGTTLGGGSAEWGTVFKMASSGALGVLYSFCAQTNCTDGEVPAGGVILATDGNLYGTTNAGGIIGDGTVFKITLQGVLGTVYDFCSQPNCADGSAPVGTLIQATGGNFYGTTQLGGTNDCGTVFKVTPGGTLTTLHSFMGNDGQAPVGGLVQASDGSLYGVTWSEDGEGNCDDNQTSGTVFTITPEGSLTTLYNFCSQPNCTDGAGPSAGLIRATDGNFYGTTEFGGTTTTLCHGGCGTIFKITPQGVLTTLHSFSGPDGVYPQATLFQATNGILYGTTEGTIFAVALGLGPFVETLPTSGAEGNTIDILSQGLTGTTAVSFNGIAASFTVVSDTYLTATVPAGATTGVVTVTTPSATLKSNQKFRITP
jgi:uncharacterized repeat protein (TIGR03803 family)